MKTEQVSETEMLANDPSSGSTDALATLGGVRLADYELTERLGAGGYGEVWKAIGPGGLPKAVKVLYGERNGEHAEAELKSLERMRELRHPFLLSIERIEVANSRLIVVTELADGSLSDRFEECRKGGDNGIPRDELLGYLRDAADALDFMSTQHGLQHLDIKPDNLLMQGGHVKVGDFGLAKDISTTNVSVLNGFTPMYAAPELFEGRPGRASDQYSLAIVYQMMLTSTPPFNGRNAAQLTAQHLRSQPDLTNLQPIDRPVIARALSKNPHSRFENCRQFVDELARRRHSRSSNKAFVQDIDDSDVSRTALLKTQSNDSLHSISHQESVPVSIKPVDVQGKALKPSVVIGVGGLAGSVLKSFKHQVSQRTQNGDCPVPLLQIDTDRDTLTTLKLSGDTVGLSPDQVLSIPLRSSNDYRSASELDLSWLSRRWLFNIPRSGKVDGIRPLGRLALCDHHQTVDGRLKAILESVLTPECREAVGQITDLPVEADGINVYVVGATSGGTSSGTVTDIGLMVKKAAREAGIEGVEVHGVLLHGTGAVRSVTDVQEANTVSVLQELRHLSTPGLGTPRGFDQKSHQTDVAPFDQNLFVHLGNGLNEDAFQEQAVDVARYLCGATISAAQLDYEEWHSHNEDDPNALTKLRVLGIDSQEAESLQVASDDAGNLSSLLLRRWTGAAISGNTEKQSPLPAELTDTQTLIAELNLTDELLPQQVMGLLRGNIGQKIEAYATGVNARLAEVHAMDSVTRPEVLDFLTGELLQKQQSDGVSLQQIVSDVQEKVSAMSQNGRTALTEHLHHLLDSPHRMEAAFAATRYTMATLQGAKSSCEDLLKRIAEAFDELASSATQNSGFSSEEDVRAFCKQYCVLLAYQTIHQCFVNYVHAVMESVAAVLSRLARLKDELEGVAASVAAPHLLTDSIPHPVIDAFDRYIRSSSPHCLSDYAASRKDPEGNVFSETLIRSAARFLMASVQGGGTSESTITESSHFPENAWPFYKKAGGQRRVLGMIPGQADADEWKQKLTKEFGPCVAIREVNDPSLSVACEIEGVPIESILLRLTVSNPHVADVAARIHTRVDVDW